MSDRVDYVPVPVRTMYDSWRNEVVFGEVSLGPFDFVDVIVGP